MRTTGFTTSYSPTITSVTEKSRIYFPLAIANSSDNHIYYYYFDTYGQYWTGGPRNLSAIIPTEASHLTPSITNIPGDDALHIAWKRLTGSGSSQYDHTIIHRKSTDYNTWPDEYTMTYYEKQEAPSITGLTQNSVHLLFHSPEQFGDLVAKMHYDGQYWNAPTTISSQGRYPSVSMGNTSAKYVWTDGWSSPYTVMLSSETLNKENPVNPFDYYTRSVALLDSSGSYLDIKIHNIGFEFTDSSIQKLNYSIAGLDSFNMTIQNCYDSLATTVLSVVPLNARKLLFDISISGQGINTLFGNIGFVPVSMKLLNNQNAVLRSIQNNFKIINGNIQEIRHTFSIPLVGLGIIPGVTQVRANFKLFDITLAEGVFASLGHIFDYTGLSQSINKNILANIQETDTDEELLVQNYPNPFNPTTQIEYSIRENGLVNVKVYDVLGNEVAELVNEEKSAGTYTINFNASHLSSGIYFYRISAKDFHQTKKMILLR